ncbi:MAG: tripartite tricarboxylate transporter substrate binding protein, partial [Betaproteobacteria bacterium]
AQSFPTKPIRLLVGASSGGTTDTLARSIAAEMTRSLGQPVVVENRAGAGGNIAAEAVAKSPADGYTLLVSFTSHTINASLYPKLPFDPLDDFTPISMIATVPSLLVGNPAVPAADLKSLLALAKAKPGKLNFAIGGIGSSLHMAGDLLKMQTGVFIVNIPYRGTAPALTDVLAGQVELMFISTVTGMQQVKAGKLRAYGVTSAKRLPAFPDIPAISEVVPGFESNAWFGVFGPAKLPAEVTRVLNNAVAKAVNSPELKKRLELEGAVPVGNTPAEFTAFVREDIKRWAPVVKYSGAKPE